METFSTDQWIILLLVLLLGWLLGLLTRSGAKWRHAYHDEEGRRKAAEARAAEAEARLHEIEKRRPPAAPARPAKTATGRKAASASAIANGGTEGRDDLSLIRAVGASGEARLHEVGIFSYHQIAELSARDEADLESRLGAPAGTIEREEWREQARMLAHGDHEDHRSRFHP